MSLFKKIGNALGKLGRVALPFLPGGAAVLATAETARNAVRGARGYGPTAASNALSLVGNGFSSFNTPAVGPMSLLPALGGAAMRGGGALLRGGGRVLRNPGVQGALGGAAGAALFDAAGNPVRMRKRRSKGITARELKSFTRVTGLLNKYCKTPPPTKRRGAPRGKACR